MGQLVTGEVIRLDESNWKSIEDMEMFKRIERFVDAVWNDVSKWPPFARDTVGKQLVRAADSIGANLVEGDGRYHHKEKLNFFYIARASAKETNFWLCRARTRNMITAERVESMLRELETLRRWINSVISKRREWMSEVKDERAEYSVDDALPPTIDPFTN